MISQDIKPFQLNSRQQLASGWLSSSNPICLVGEPTWKQGAIGGSKSDKHATGLRHGPGNLQAYGHLAEFQHT